MTSSTEAILKGCSHSRNAAMDTLRPIHCSVLSNVTSTLHLLHCTFARPDHDPLKD